MVPTSNEQCKNLAALADLERSVQGIAVLQTKDRVAKRYTKWLCANLEIGAKACKACLGESDNCGIIKVISFMNSDDVHFLSENGFDLTSTPQN